MDKKQKARHAKRNGSPTPAQAPVLPAAIEARRRRTSELAAELRTATPGQPGAHWSPANADALEAAQRLRAVLPGRTENGFSKNNDLEVLQ